MQSKLKLMSLTSIPINAIFPKLTTIFHPM